MITYPVVEKFVSINGEGQKAGEIAAFIRMRGCNLACNYCDTSWANTKDCPCEFLSAEELITWLKEHSIENVTLTGGEPLLTEEIAPLIEALGTAGFSVEIETNGSVSLNTFDTLAHRPAFTMDYKCPDSGMENAMNTDNFSLLIPKDTVKFVVSSISDLDKARKICIQYKVAEHCPIFLSPVFGRIEPKEIVEYMIEHHWNEARLQLQMHKFIWPPEQRGVQKGGKNMAIDKDAIREHVRGILAALGDDPDREGLKETPDRVARMYEEVFEGMNYTNHEIAMMFNKSFKDDLCVGSDKKDIVLVRDIPIFSYCEHHIALMYDMSVSVAYIPKEKVLGLSKIARICDMASKRLQLQERIGSDIAEIMCEAAETDDVAVIIHGTHSCMSARGIKKEAASTVTTTFRGRFETDAAIQSQLTMMLHA